MFKRIRAVAEKNAQTNQDLYEKSQKSYLSGHMTKLKEVWGIGALSGVAMGLGGAVLAPAGVAVSGATSFSALALAAGAAPMLALTGLGIAGCAAAIIPLGLMAKKLHDNKDEKLGRSVRWGDGDEKNVKLSDYVKATALVAKDKIVSLFTGKKVELNNKWKPSSTVVRNSINENENRQKMIR
jgi:hypothetical protein